MLVPPEDPLAGLLALGPLVLVVIVGPAVVGGAGRVAIAVAETTAVAATTVRRSSMVIVCPSAW